METINKVSFTELDNQIKVQFSLPKKVSEDHYFFKSGKKVSFLSQKGGSILAIKCIMTNFVYLINGQLFGPYKGTILWTL